MPSPPEDDDPLRPGAQDIVAQQFGAAVAVATDSGSMPKGPASTWARLAYSALKDFRSRATPHALLAAMQNSASSTAEGPTDAEQTILLANADEAMGGVSHDPHIPEASDAEMASDDEEHLDSAPDCVALSPDDPQARPDAANRNPDGERGQDSDSSIAPEPPTERIGINNPACNSPRAATHTRGAHAAEFLDSGASRDAR